MDGSRKIVFGILVLSVFVFVISVTSLYVQVTIESGDVCGCLIPLPFFIPFVGSTGLFIGTLVYYLFTPRLERRHSGPGRELLLKLMGEGEAEIMKALAGSGGELSQARLMALTGMSKVKVFRTLERMRARGMIEKRPLGKTNAITMVDGFRNFLETR